MTYLNKETLSFVANELVKAGWRAHSESTTGFFLQKEIAASEVLSKGRLLSQTYVPYDELKARLGDTECLVQITEIDGVDVVSTMFEDWHGTPMQYEYNPLKGYYALAASEPLYKKVSKALYYSVRFAA